MCQVAGKTALGCHPLPKKKKTPKNLMVCVLNAVLCRLAWFFSSSEQVVKERRRRGGGGPRAEAPGPPGEAEGQGDGRLLHPAARQSGRDQLPQVTQVLQYYYNFFKKIIIKSIKTETVSSQDQMASRILNIYIITKYICIKKTHSKTNKNETTMRHFPQNQNCKKNVKNVKKQKSKWSKNYDQKKSQI